MTDNNDDGGDDYDDKKKTITFFSVSASIQEIILGNIKELLNCGVLKILHISCLKKFRASNNFQDINFIHSVHADLVT